MVEEASTGCVIERFLEEVDIFEVARDVAGQVQYNFEKKQRMIDRAQALGVVPAYQCWTFAPRIASWRVKLTSAENELSAAGKLEEEKEPDKLAAMPYNNRRQRAEVLIALYASAIQHLEARRGQTLGIAIGALGIILAVIALFKG